MTEENKKEHVLGAPEPNLEQTEESKQGDFSEQTKEDNNESTLQINTNVDEKNSQIATKPRKMMRKWLEPDYRAYAGFWIRFWAYLVDLIVIGGLQLILIQPFSIKFDWDITGIFSPYTILSGMIYFAYFVLMTKYLGQTLGKMVFGLKVISLKGKELTWDVVLFRELVGRYISKAFNGLLYLVVAFLPRKQGLHDLFAETAVVHEAYEKKEEYAEYHA